MNVGTKMKQIWSIKQNLLIERRGVERLPACNELNDRHSSTGNVINFRRQIISILIYRLRFSGAFFYSRSVGLLMSLHFFCTFAVTFKYVAVVVDFYPLLLSISIILKIKFCIGVLFTDNSSNHRIYDFFRAHRYLIWVWTS